MAIESVATVIAKNLVDHAAGKRCIVFIGNTKTPSDSPVKGYVRTPMPALLRKLKEFADVIEVSLASMVTIIHNRNPLTSNPKTLTTMSIYRSRSMSSGPRSCGRIATPIHRQRRSAVTNTVHNVGNGGTET